jgi:hypothetical protein
MNYDETDFELKLESSFIYVLKNPYPKQTHKRNGNKASETEVIIPAQDEKHTSFSRFSTRF